VYTTDVVGTTFSQLLPDCYLKHDCKIPVINNKKYVIKHSRYALYLGFSEITYPKLNEFGCVKKWNKWPVDALIKKQLYPTQTTS